MSGKALTTQAQKLDREIRLEAEATRRSIVTLGEKIAQMRDSKLWRYLLDRNGKPKYTSLEQYAQSVLGPMASSRYFEIVAAHSLTQGENSIPKETVDKLGVKKAAELARLAPGQRTAELVAKATVTPVSKVRRMVQEKLNEHLPSVEQREVLVPFTRMLMPETVELFEEIEEDGIWLEGNRDGDRSVSLRAKLYHAIAVFFLEAHAEELAEGRKFRLAHEARGQKS